MDFARQKQKGAKSQQETRVNRLVLLWEGEAERVKWNVP